MVATNIGSERNIVLDSEFSGDRGNLAAFQFTGNGFEYFKIWIVTVALTILTLGIYSAWAKVRRKRYFLAIPCWRVTRLNILRIQLSS